MTMPPDGHPASLAEYFRREELAVDKHEYRDGLIITMGGWAPEHSLVTANTIAAMANRLDASPCRVYEGGLRIGIPHRALYTYPDLSVICGRPMLDPDDPTRGTVMNPRIIVEVLSPATESYDRGEKFERYRSLESIEEYVLIAVDNPRVEVFRRTGEGQWRLTWASDLTSSAKLNSLEIELPLSEIYAGVEFPVDSAASDDGR